MNAHYGYPIAGPMLLGRLGQSGDDLSVTVWGILDGSVLQDLQQAQSDYQKYAAQLDTAKAAIAQMPPGPAKTNAQNIELAGEGSLRQQFVSYRQARDLYNQFATAMQTYGFGTYQPPLMSGLGQIEPTTAIVAAIIGVAALAALASQLAGVISAMHGNAVETKGYIDQLGDLTGALAKLFPAVGSGLQKVAIAAAIGLGVFVLYKIFEKRQASSGSSAPTALPTPTGAAA